MRVVQPLVRVRLALVCGIGRDHDAHRAQALRLVDLPVRRQRCDPRLTDEQVGLAGNEADVLVPRDRPEVLDARDSGLGHPLNDHTLQLGLVGDLDVPSSGY